jgi:uncharacterized membrane protein
MTAPNQTGLSDNAAGAIAYITFVPAVVFLVLDPYKQSSFVRFHAWQSIFLNIAAFIISFALSIFVAFAVFLGPAMFVFIVFTRLVWLAWVLIWVLCVVQAINGKRFGLPIIGPLAEKQAGF